MPLCSGWAIIVICWIDICYNNDNIQAFAIPLYTAYTDELLYRLCLIQPFSRKISTPFIVPVPQSNFTGGSLAFSREHAGKVCINYDTKRT